MMSAHQREELATVIDKFSSGDGIHATAIPGVHCIKFSEPNARLPSVYKPCLCVISVSSFHAHFKTVTAMSPLQYQKRIRLLEARQIMLVEMQDAASTAYRVGYESPSQFSREYARLFGNPPGRDINRLMSAQASIHYQ